MPERSPWRLRETATRVYYIYRSDDEMESGEVIHCSKEEALALVARRHRDWHMRRHPDPLKRFLYFQCAERHGHRIPLAEFWDRFSKTLSRYERPEWSKRTIAERLPGRLPVGPATGNVTSIGNLTFDRRAKHKARRYRMSDGRLRLSQ